MKVNVETAQDDVNRWLEIKKVGESKRQSMNDSINNLVDAVADGTISIDSEGMITQNLKFPLGEDKSITALTYKPRISVGEAKKWLKDIKAGDIDGRLTAYVAALTGQAKEVINKLDSEDNGVAQSIAVFFL